MLNDPFDKWPKRDETWLDMKQRHEKEKQFSDQVAIMLLFLVIAPFVCYMVIDVLDKHFK